jgi:probable rRNA maturation factor
VDELHEEGRSHPRGKPGSTLIIARPKLTGVSMVSLERFALAAKRAARLRGEVAILVTNSASIRRLNRDFRKKDKPTDVLSFPSAAEGLAGDIAISAQIASKQAKALGHTLGTELKVLILHGMIHLAGHDHESDEGEMAALEAKLQKKLKLPQGLIERTNSAEATSRTRTNKQAVRRSAR